MSIRLRKGIAALLLAALVSGCEAAGGQDGADPRGTGESGASSAEAGARTPPAAAAPLRSFTSCYGSAPVRCAPVTEKPAAVRRLEPDWVNRGSLAYMYLRYVTPKALILFGDDGGLSGMHMNDNLYAVSPETGRTLWQIDGGFGGSRTALDRSRQELTVLNPYTPGQGYEYRLRHLNAATGRTIWEQKLGKADGRSDYTEMYAAKGIILLYGYEPDSQTARLLALNEKDGRTLWKKALKGDRAVVNEGGEDVVLLKSGPKLTGLEPGTGSLRWSLTGKDEPDSALETAPYDPLLEPAPLPADPAAGAEPVRWFRLGGERLRIDLSSGEVQARIQARGDLIGSSGNLLLTREFSGPFASDRTRPEIVLTDAATGRERWRLKGSGGPAVFAGNTLYLYLNGPLAAVDAADGEIRWSQPLDRAFYNPEGYAESAGLAVYALPGNRLLEVRTGGGIRITRADDGETLYRVSGVSAGIPEGREAAVRRGLVNTQGDRLYLGSDSGRFFRIPLPLP
ncbi:PQQ-binding-like beta-propeller repeat protein [Paenibacillus spiritus]|uniref:PQQ-binding-like beta-propeller repeat protein n=1 Tax=Paenibacillus spiritus TaxID=2496557 RepID=A0A5J5G9A5_9BACL|nr:PQQ-binding-like beta-propeller repeat protein [Paenibacillus spiritus]KAA9004697.1 PQQ-binding-like beta-propeller repeat protein [Paenibacillus spiritus]